MIVALLNQKGGVGKTTLALHLAGRWAELGERVLVVDADPQGSALDWQAARGREGLAKPFTVVGLPRDLLHLDLPDLARGYDRVVIDGPPRMGVITRSALIAADLVLIPATPSPMDGWASAEMLRLLGEARVYRPALPARLLLNRVAARTVIARETVDELADHDPPVLDAHVGQRIAFADTARSGRLVHEVPAGAIAAQEIAAAVAEIDGLAR